MMLRGERRRLLLSNAAIDAYRLRPVVVIANARARVAAISS